MAALGAAEVLELLVDAVETEVEVAAGDVIAETATASAATETTESTAEDLVSYVTANGGSTEAAGEASGSEVAEIVIDRYWNNMLQNETLLDATDVSDSEISMRVQTWIDSIPDDLDPDDLFDVEQTEVKRTSTPIAPERPVTGVRSANIKDLEFHRDFFKNSSICNRLLRAYGRIRRARFVVEDMPSGIQTTEKFIAPGAHHSDSNVSSLGSSLFGRNTGFASQLPIEEPGMETFFEQAATYIPRRAAQNVMRVLSVDPFILYNPTIVGVVRKLGLNIVSQPKFSMYLLWLVGVEVASFGFSAYLIIENLKLYSQLVNKYVPNIEESVFSKYNKPWTDNDIFKLVYEVDVQVLNSLFKKKSGVNGLNTLLKHNELNQLTKGEGWSTAN